MNAHERKVLHIGKELGLSSDYPGYINIIGNRVTLDGEFTADDLRKIASEIDSVNAAQPPIPHGHDS